MARCNDCNKFVSLDTDVEPEEESAELSFSTTADYDVNVKIENNCADCGTTIKTADLNMSGSFDVDIDEYDEDDRDNWTIEVVDLMRTERGEGVGRGARTYYGAECVINLLDGNGELIESKNESDEIQASHMEDY